LALDDDGARPQLIETIFVPRGAEERAVRRGLAQAGSSIRVVATGIGPLAAAHAADEALAAASFGTALSTGLCGALSPSFVVGDTLVYRELVREGASPIALDRALAESVAGRLPGSQSGVRGIAGDTILTSVEQKRAAAARYRADAVDMESFALAERLGRAGVAVAVVRIASDAIGDDLPDLNRALDGSGGIDSLALALAMLSRPFAAVALARNGTRALAALERIVRQLAAS
jgi:adenosylhomocysteine nucleosidase